MDIEVYPPMLPSRPCRFCLCLQEGCVFADFDVDTDGRIFAVRVSFDGHGCCPTEGKIGRMSEDDSRALLAMVERDMLGDEAEKILRAYFSANRDALWSDALEENDLV